MSESTKAVFLSYAREDTAAAQRIGEALRSQGIEVWFDQSELRGGDAWDGKIKKQIRDCLLFLPFVSQQTQARAEGYFRREWKLAVERTHDMAAGVAFILPIVIDETREADAAVPEEFMRYQWSHLPGALPTPQFVEQIKRLLSAPRKPIGTGATRPMPSVAAQGPLAAQSTAGKSVAVLAFANMSQDPENEYFSDGISEELLNVLAKIPSLHVAARTSTFYFKGKNVPIPEIARVLGVRYVVEGSVRKAGNRVRITAQLINAADGYHLWSDRFDRTLDDIFAVQDEIAALIAGNLQLKLGGMVRTQLSVDPEAHRLVLEGRHFVAMRWAGFVQAEKSFTKAIQIDPGFAPAHAGLAEVLGLRGLYNLTEARSPADDDFPRGIAAAERAVELDPSLAEPHAALGLVSYIQRRWPESEHHFQTALRLNQNYGMAYHWHGMLLGVVGEFDLALAALDKAVRLDPLGHTSLYTYASYLNAAGRLDESLAIVERALEIAPTHSALPVYRGLRSLNLLALGRRSEAIDEAQVVRGLPIGPKATPRWWADAEAIYVLCQTGAQDEAEAYLRELQTRLALNSHLFGYVLCATGQFEKGVALLSTVEPMCQTRLYFQPIMEVFHGSERMKELFAGIGSAEEYRHGRETVARMRKDQDAKRWTTPPKPSS